MRNLEVKIAVTDTKKMLEAIRRLGAVYQHAMRQQDYYFSVGEDKRKLRVIDGKEYQLVTYRRVEKLGRKDSQYTLETLGAQEAEALLAHEPVVRAVEKNRELWMYRNTRIHLDRVEGLGDFLELETVIKDISPKEGEKEFSAVAAWLGINLAGSVAASYSDLIPAAKNEAAPFMISTKETKGSPCHDQTIKK